MTISSAIDSALTGMRNNINDLGDIARKGFETDLANDMVELLKIRNDFKANTKVIKTADEMLGSILDIIV